MCVHIDANCVSIRRSVLGAIVESKCLVGDIGRLARASHQKTALLLIL